MIDSVSRLQETSCRVFRRPLIAQINQQPRDVTNKFPGPHNKRNAISCQWRPLPIYGTLEWRDLFCLSRNSARKEREKREQYMYISYCGTALASSHGRVYIYMCVFFFSLSALLLTGCMFRLSDSFAEAMEKKTFECPDGFRSIGNFQRDSVR